jgi:glycosyltransferase EpsH
MKKNYTYKINEYKEIFIEILKNILFNDKYFFVYDILSKTLLFIFLILFLNSVIDKNNSRTLLLRKSKKFMDLCLKQSLIKYNFNKEINNPKLSVIIPIYNCENTIKIAISSIQNQNISDFEIILVNDFSQDNSLKIIKGLSLEDSRIKILNNNKNMGTLYSRCIGVLISNGAYIFPLDNDDLFMDDDVFDVIVKESEKGNYDIVGFKAIRGPNYKPRISDMEDDIYHDNPDNLILNQPELGIHSITKNGKYDINNIHIWGKCIKKKIYEKTINILGEKKYKQFMSWAEDTSMVFALFNIAHSYKFTSKYGVFHLMSKKTACYTQPDENKLFGEIEYYI